MGYIISSFGSHTNVHNRLAKFIEKNNLKSRSHIIQSAISMYLDKQDDDNIEVILSKLTDKGKRKLFKKLELELFRMDKKKED